MNANFHEKTVSVFIVDNEQVEIRCTTGAMVFHIPIEWDAFLKIMRQIVALDEFNKRRDK